MSAQPLTVSAPARPERCAPTPALAARTLCRVCGYDVESPGSGELGVVRGNTARFRSREFRLRKCPVCGSIRALDAVDLADVYRDYPLNRRRLDGFARGTLGNLLRRLRSAGLESSDSILDYGCGNGLFLEFLRLKGFARVSGYDPYVPEFGAPPEGPFDCVVANDVIEHVDDPRSTLGDCARLVRPGGLLYIGTADSEPVRMDDLDRHAMRLHQPFHRTILTQATLLRLAAELGMERVRAWRRSYMDTLVPFANYRFLDEMSRATGHNMDAMLAPSAARLVARSPRLLFFGFLGYFFPSAAEPAVVLRKPGGG
jgi:2-polyprenyl-3-methyl-5-hydroxy-6-metoxy-1,4-benzoquinol methylase